tara:strand:+ start:261 stop:404 length:144 start_codon:yes stop_codon:yes gene_type:complete
MNIQAEKIALARMLLETDNPKIIESIKKIFKKRTKPKLLGQLICRAT